MNELHNIEVEKNFIEVFDEGWNKTIKSYNVSQAQLDGGSRLRPLMVLWGYLANYKDFKKADMQYISNIAVSIELIHKATILLDDWIDNDIARHGKKAFHIEYDPYYTVILALHMVSDSIIRLKKYLPSVGNASNSYSSISNLIAETIHSMSKGALEELRLDSNLLNLDKINLIAKLETAEIIGNAMQIGYQAGLGNDIEIRRFLKRVGDTFGYLFQAMNDLEVFADTESLVKHKGAVNNDVNISRKNLGVALLYNVAKKSDKDLIINGSQETIKSLIKKYNILEHVIQETELFYSNITDEFANTHLPVSWRSSFMKFMDNMKTIAYSKLGLK